MIIKYIFFYAYCFFLFSCQSEQQKNQEIIKTWMNKKIIFPTTLEYSKQDSLWKAREHKKFTILTVIDSSGCSDCKLNLYEWKKIMQQADNIKDYVTFLFIVHPERISKIEWIRKKNSFHHPIFYDPKNKMQTLNHFHTNSMFRTFLLNSKNEVILVGSPINNFKLWDLYKTTITKE